ncbi:MAG: hypothetical protein QXP42_04620 [Candidatus Micrarchaeia archaeon]
MQGKAGAIGKGGEIELRIALSRLESLINEYMKTKDADMLLVREAYLFLKSAKMEMGECSVDGVEYEQRAVPIFDEPVIEKTEAKETSGSGRASLSSEIVYSWKKIIRHISQSAENVCRNVTEARDRLLVEELLEKKEKGGS